MRAIASVGVLVGLMASWALSAYAQWYQQPFPSGETLWNVRFVNQNTGWVLGGLGYLFKTTDGGTSWNEQDSWDGGGWTIYPLSEDTVLYSRWISGVEGQSIRRSVDGGSTWETVDSLGSNSSWYDEFDFVDNSLGFVVGKVDTGSGPLFLIRKTTDAGETWEPIWMDEHDNYELTGVSFVDDLNGWICSYLDGVFRTTDGGNAWVKMTSFNPPLGGPSRDLMFTTPDSGWVVGGISGFQTVSRTTDGGQTWEYSGQQGGSSLREVQMLNSQVGWFVGSVNLPPYIACTVDGGDTWIEQDPVPENFGFESISIIDESLGWVVGSSGAIYKTTNGGTAWVSPGPGLPDQFMLAQNYPNPFNAQTRLTFTVRNPQSIVLQVYDLLGREVAKLVNGKREAGVHNVTWDAAGLPSGVYFYRLQAGGFVETRKLVLLR